MNSNRILNPIKYFESGEYPNISTDFAPIVCGLLGIADGLSTFKETIHPSRFKYIQEINKFNGNFKNISDKLNEIQIYGVKNGYQPAEATCTDIRGGMVLLMAALSANGVSILNDCYHIFRGYETFISKINNLGGNIEPFFESIIK